MPRKTRLNVVADLIEEGYNEKELRDFARNSIIAYFCDKKYHTGGKIPPSLLVSRPAIDTLLYTSFEHLDYIHSSLLPRLKHPEKWNDPTVSFQTNYLLNLLEDARRRHIAKPFQPGLAVLYFKFCKGYNVANPKQLVMMLGS